jgi:hypothetical protein
MTTYARVADLDLAIQARIEVDVDGLRKFSEGAEP